MEFNEMDTTKVVQLLNDYYSVEYTLKRRGYDVKGYNNIESLIANSDDFYNSMKSISFRHIIRTIYDNENGISLNDLLIRNRSIDRKNLNERLINMTRNKFVGYDEINKIYFPIKDKNYGTSFEWFISEIIKREMKGISAFGVKILNLKSGGDYDVICRLEDIIIYIESKAGSINNITSRDISNFLYRDKDLNPSLSIFLIDSNGLTDNFKESFKSADWGQSNPRIPKKRRLKGRGIFYEVDTKIHCLTNELNLIGNIKLSINHYFSYIKPYGTIGPGPKSLASIYDEYEINRLY